MNTDSLLRLIESSFSSAEPPEDLFRSDNADIESIATEYCFLKRSWRELADKLPENIYEVRENLGNLSIEAFHYYLPGCLYYCIREYGGLSWELLGSIVFYLLPWCSKEEAARKRASAKYPLRSIGERMEELDSSLSLKNYCEKWESEFYSYTSDQEIACLIKCFEFIIEKEKNHEDFDVDDEESILKHLQAKLIAQTK